jgi:signal transduction histidine kinase/CheY-like chemotaxis protein
MIRWNTFRHNFLQKVVKLHFQTLAPTLVVLILFLTAFSCLTWVLSNQFTTLQQELSASTNASRSLLEISRLRGDAKELLLLYRITRETKYLSEINAIEMERNLQSNRLEREVQKIQANEFLLQSFLKGGRENSHLRDQILESVASGDANREARLFNDYSTLYDINSARLTDLHSLIYSRLTGAEEGMREMLQKTPVILISMMIMAVLLTLSLIRFYRQRVLNPLSLLHGGLGAVSTGRLGEFLPVPASAIEIKEMIQDFNAMTAELHKMTRELTGAQEKALQAANAKSEFLANMSHEIRTPLNVIVGLADLIQERSLDAETRKDISILNKSTRFLLSVVNDILDYSRLESGQVHVAQDAFNLTEKIHNVAALVQPLANAKNIELKVQVAKDLPTQILGDSQLFEQALLNLANNAVKFTAKGHVCIKANLQQESALENRSDLWLELSVTDTGIGVPADKLDNLFTRFAQADSSITRTHGGTGLGLAIVKQIATLCHGDVQVISTEGKGSTFTMRIPLIAAPEEKSQSIPAKPLDRIGFSFSRNAKILLVDDSEDNRYLIRTYLKNSGVEIIEAQNGREALAAFSSQQFDVILMDVQMPDIDGYQATREIRRLEEQSQRNRTPVIALTAFALKEEVERSFAHGCDAHMTKPVHKAKLIQAIEDFL